MLRSANNGMADSGRGHPRRGAAATRHTIDAVVMDSAPVNGQAHVTVTCLILRQYHMTIWVMKKYLAPRGIEPTASPCSLMEAKDNNQYTTGLYYYLSF